MKVYIDGRLKDWPLSNRKEGSVVISFNSDLGCCCDKYNYCGLSVKRLHVAGVTGVEEGSRVYLMLDGVTPSYLNGDLRPILTSWSHFEESGGGAGQLVSLFGGPVE